MTTSSSTKTLRVLGFMTGTSLDAVDMAVIETDGETIISFGPAGEMKLDAETRAIVEDAIEDALDWEREEEEPDSFEDARMAVADAHLAAALAPASAHGLAVDQWLKGSPWPWPRIRDGRLQLSRHPGLGFTPG